MVSTSKRGFASMDPTKQREIASKGGKAAHAKGTAHEFTPDEARVAGRKGGEAVSRDRAHMAAIGREGGHSRGAHARAAAAQGRTDISRGAGEQVFERQVSLERSGFERPALSSGRSATSGERTDTSRGDAGPFSSRDQV